MRRNVVSIVVVAPLAASIAAGCSHHRSAAPPMPGTVPSTKADDAIARVQRANHRYSSFPNGRTAEACVIHGGGPAPGLRIEGRCRTSVVDHAGRTVVSFTETWPWKAFHYSGSPRRTQRHTWRFVVSPAGHVSAAGDDGDFPPELVK